MFDLIHFNTWDNIGQFRVATVKNITWTFNNSKDAVKTGLLNSKIHHPGVKLSVKNLYRSGI